MNNEYNPGQTILGSLKSANKLGNPWHDARNGEFTSGPAAASVSPSSANATKKDLPREHSHAMDFIETHHKDAATIAASLNVPTEMILGLSGIEIKWGQGRFAVQGNNYFSQHAGKHVPFQQGSIVARGDGPMAAFASYLDSGRCFVALYGNTVRGIKDPIAFSQALVYARFNSGQKKTGGNDNFVASTAKIIISTKRRMQFIK